MLTYFTGKTFISSLAETSSKRTCVSCPTHKNRKILNCSNFMQGKKQSIPINIMPLISRVARRGYPQKLWGILCTQQQSHNRQK
jgi:hypothetical protein